MKKSIIKKITAFAACVAMVVPVMTQAITTSASESGMSKVIEEHTIDIPEPLRTSQTVLSGYSWQHQEHTKWCWAATGSMVFSKVFDTPISQSDIAAVLNKGIGDDASFSDLSLALSHYNNVYSTSHTWSSFAPNSTSGLSQIKAIINNGKAPILKTSYTKNNQTVYHMVLCIGFKVLDDNTTQLRIFDPGPSLAANGKYWTGTYSSTNIGYNTSLYGDVHIVSCGYVTPVTPPQR